MSEIVLHGYWRSSASYRLRIALNLKGLAYSQVEHDLRSGAQRDPAYLAIAPHGLVPTIAYDGIALIESPAILEWLEVRWPTPPLLPKDPNDAAHVRAISALIACDIHPLNNLRVLGKLRSDFGATQEQIRGWIAHWIGEGFSAVESLLQIHGGQFAYGDSPSLADCYLVPQVYNAERFAVDLAAFPKICAAAEAARALPSFAAAHPDQQGAAHLQA
jgi:maleylpyruvate isomerase